MEALTDAIAKLARRTRRRRWWIFVAAALLAGVALLRATAAQWAAPLGFGGVTQKKERTRGSEPSFRRSKRALREIYATHRLSLYCGCAFDERWRVDAASCGYRGRGNKRAERIEWEHVVPAHALGGSFAAWRDGHAKCVGNKGTYKGRACARKISRSFREMEANMHNLYPAIGEVNARRSNFSMAMIEGETRAFGACDVEIAGRTIEPRPAVRGEIARTYRYMHQTYPGRGLISRKNQQLIRTWNEQDPVDAWECQRARTIDRAQGGTNAVVGAACATAGL